MEFDEATGRSETRWKKCPQDNNRDAMEDEVSAMNVKIQKLYSRVECVEQIIETRLPAANNANSPAAITKKKKKKRKKKKNKGGSKSAANWFGRNLAKIAVGAASIALLITLSISVNLDYSPFLRRGAQAQRASELQKTDSTGDDRRHLLKDSAQKVHDRDRIAPEITNLSIISNSYSKNEEDHTSSKLPASETSQTTSTASSPPQTNQVPGEDEGIPEIEIDVASESSRTVPQPRLNAPVTTSLAPGALPKSSRPSDLHVTAPRQYSQDHEGVGAIISTKIRNADLESGGTNLCFADPKNCGCQHLNRKDYRGFINRTQFGVPCNRWDSDQAKAFVRTYFPEQWEKIYVENRLKEFGLEENFCRNPFPTGDEPERAWCITKAGLSIYCEVPRCQRPTDWCKKPSEQTCGCADEKQANYQGNISETKEGFTCIDWEDSKLANFLDEGLVGHNYCRNRNIPGIMRKWERAWCYADPDGDGISHTYYCDVDECPARTCMPSCGTPNLSNNGCPSFLQSEECCQEDDSSCKCTLLMDACRKSIENDIHFVIEGEIPDFCDNALATCYVNDNNPDRICSLYERICSEFPGTKTCDAAAWACCAVDLLRMPKDANWLRPQCLCDFSTFANSQLNLFVYETKCEAATLMQLALNEEVEGDVKRTTTTALEKIYNGTGGEHWTDNRGWLDGTIHHCHWYGLKCNEDDNIIEINLGNNNLTGEIEKIFLPGLSELTRLDIAGNNLAGNLYNHNLKYYSDVALFFRKLVYIDISDNNFSGCADMTFPPGTLHANFSNNQFACVRFKRYNPAYETLRVIDLSHNVIDEDTRAVFLNIPPNIETLILSDNSIHGVLPNPFPILDKILRLDISNNNINGPLPDFSRATSRMRELDLSSQRQTENGGMTGTISPDFSRLDDLSVLNLAFNNLTSFPSDLGSLQKLKILNLSSNSFSQTIPSELGNLDALETLDLSLNTLTGLIPKSFSSFVDRSNTLVYLRGDNKNLSEPAPLMLCFLSDFDYGDDDEMCPPERNALKVFYESAKGQEWTNDKGWLHPYESHCNWHGINCSSSSETINLTLSNNGLSGTISKDLEALSLLEILDLSDNDIKGSVPPEIGNLIELIQLRLSYNELTGTIPEDFFSNLTKVNLIQLQSNRIRGNVALEFEWTEEKWKEMKDQLPFLTNYDSSFVTDCGNPSDFEESLKCEECTMCCNAHGDCYPQKEIIVEKALGLRDYSEFSMMFFGLIAGISFVVAWVSGPCIPDASTPEEDKKYALNTMGNDSVYQFILGERAVGWLISVLTVGLQLILLFIFVLGGEIELSEGSSDLVYTWQCPRDEVMCSYTGDLDWKGWVAFAILMGFHLLEDIINGFKMTVLSGNRNNTRGDRIKFFCGGALLNFVSLFTVFVSAIYNGAIATSNTEVIVNSVIILFIIDGDEQLYKILGLINSKWVAGMCLSLDTKDESNEEMNSHNSKLEAKVNSLATEVEKLQGQLEEKDERYKYLSGDSSKLQAKVKSLEAEVENLLEQMNHMREMIREKETTSVSQAQDRNLSNASIESEQLSFDTAFTSSEPIGQYASDEREE